jgi:hypothetical protein
MNYKKTVEAVNLNARLVVVQMELGNMLVTSNAIKRNLGDQIHQTDA